MKMLTAAVLVVIATGANAADITCQYGEPMLVSPKFLKELRQHWDGTPVPIIESVGVVVTLDQSVETEATRFVVEYDPMRSPKFACVGDAHDATYAGTF